MDEKSHIEDFFKKRIAEHDFAFREEDWHDMENRMDAAGLIPPAPNAWLTPGRFALILLLSLAVAFILGWLARDRWFAESDTVNDSSASRETSQPIMSILKDQQSEISNGDNDSFGKASFAAETKRVEMTAIVTHEVMPSEPHSVSISEELNAVEPDINVAPKLRKSIASSHHPDNELRIAEDTKNEIAEDLDGDPVEVPPDLMPMEPKTGLLYSGNHGYKDAKTVSHALPSARFGEVSADKTGERSFLSRWSLRLMSGPEWTSVGLMEERSFSFLSGGMIQFNFSSRWGISSGILYSHKKYNTHPDSYEPPEGYWNARTNGILPDKIIGSCQVVDIPVNLIYHVPGRNRFSYSAAVGLSSYILLDEYYDFEFDTENPGAAEGWYTHENTRANWSVANLAAAIYFQPFDRFSIGLEPFVKIPLKQVGWGNVELTSVGITGSITYQLFK